MQAKKIFNSYCAEFVMLLISLSPNFSSTYKTWMKKYFLPKTILHVEPVQFLGDGWWQGEPYQLYAGVLPLRLQISCVLELVGDFQPDRRLQVFLVRTYFMCVTLLDEKTYFYETVFDMAQKKTLKITFTEIRASRSRKWAYKTDNKKELRHICLEWNLKCDTSFWSYLWKNGEWLHFVFGFPTHYWYISLK